MDSLCGATKSVTELFFAFCPTPIEKEFSMAFLLIVIDRTNRAEF